MQGQARSGRSSPGVRAGVPRVPLPRPAWGDSTNAHGPGAARCEAQPEAAGPVLAFRLVGRAAGRAGCQTKGGLSQPLSWHGPRCLGVGGCLPRERRASPPRQVSFTAYNPALPYAIVRGGTAPRPPPPHPGGPEPLVVLLSTCVHQLHWATLSAGTGPTSLNEHHT